MMTGALTICGTPIGNLEDISLRVLRVLKEVDIIAAEDTRHTLKLLNFYEITTPLTSYHQHNAAQKGPELVLRLKRGQNIALVSDAGMPGISDPGEDLVRLCHENSIPVTSAPGPTALTTALALSGLSVRKFVFEGFLPQNKKDRRDILNDMKAETRTLVFYEAPHHLKQTLKDIYDIVGERNIALTREMTKKFEEIQRFPLSEALHHFESNTPKGEYVVLVSGVSREALTMQKQQAFEALSVEEHVTMYEHEYGMDQKAAMKAVAKERGVSKSVIYARLNKK